MFSLSVLFHGGLIYLLRKVSAADILFRLNQIFKLFSMRKTIWYRTLRKTKWRI